MKERRYFSYKKRGHTAYNCPKKGEIAVIQEGVSEDSDSQREKYLFSKLKKETCLFLYYSCQKTYFIRVFLLFNVY